MCPRRGDGAGRAREIVGPVSAAGEREREQVTGERNGGVRLERWRQSLVRQGNKHTADGVEPETTGGSAAPPVFAPAGAGGSHGPRAGAARFCRGARRQA